MKQNHAKPVPTSSRGSSSAGKASALLRSALPEIVKAGEFGETTRVHADAQRGRGALSNASSRFDGEKRVRIDDGWGEMEKPVGKLRTALIRDKSKSIIARNKSPDLGFNQSINPYRGCEHGCVYCFARPSHAYLGYSPGLDFESKLLYKPQAAELLKKELARPGYQCQPIAFGTNTDPYQPVESKLGLTRQLLEVLSEHNHPVTIVTKSDLILRDLDILASMADRRLVKVAISVTSLDKTLARRMEPRAARPDKRLAAIEKLSEAGIPTGVMVAPLIPGLNDQEMERILEEASWAGAKSANYILLRLPLEIAELWREWLDEHYPERARRVMQLIRGARGGKDYDSSFGLRMRGDGPFANMLQRRFDLATKRFNLNSDNLQHVYQEGLDISRFSPPDRVEETAQLSLL